MSWFTKIMGSTSNNIAEVDANNQLKVALPTTVANAGYAFMMSQNDDGSVTGTKSGYSPYVSDEKRLSVGLDTVLFNDTFNMTAQNTSLWKYVTATMTTTWNTTGLILNASQTLTTGTGTQLTSYRQVTLFGSAGVVINMKVGLTAALLANQVIELGLFGFGAGTAAPTEGVYFRLTSAGLTGVENFNGTETTIALTASFTANQIYTLSLLITEKEVYFLKDGIYLGEIYTAAANGQPFVTTSMPISFQFRNSGTVSGSPVATLRITDVDAVQKELNLNKPYPHQMSAVGQCCWQGQNGGTLGTTALLPNATAATTVTGTALSQSAAIATGLGGQAGITAAVPGIDGIITSFQNPAGSVNQTPRTLFITGVRISSVNIGAAVATTPSTLQWSIAFGHTAIALTTAVGVAAKAPVRIPLGVQSWIATAAIGAPANDIVHQFSTPIVVNPGEFIQSVAKFIQGTATASQVIWSTVMFEGYFQ